jgi:hypothetical protein
MPLAGTQLTAREIAKVAHQAGWRDENLIKAVAVALAESGGYTEATNTNSDGSIDRGLWQLNNKYQPQVSDACAFDPACATREAYKIYRDRSYTFNPWAAYTSGAYKKHLAAATRGICNYWREKYELPLV